MVGVAEITMVGVADTISMLPRWFTSAHLCQQTPHAMSLPLLLPFSRDSYGEGQLFHEGRTTCQINHLHGQNDCICSFRLRGVEPGSGHDQAHNADIVLALQKWSNLFKIKMIARTMR